MGIWDTGSMGLKGIGVLYNAETPGGGTEGIRSHPTDGHTGVEMSGGGSTSTKVDGKGGVATMFVVFAMMTEGASKITLGLSQLVADCCGSVAFNPLNEICCNGTIQTRFNSRAKCCGNDLMCGDDPYNHQDHICCSGKRHKKASVLTMCCGQDAYTMSDDNMLCCNGNLHRDVPEQSDHNKINGNFCCGSDVYDHHNQSLRCCSDRLYIQHSSGNAKCCGNLLLQHSNQTCCSSSTNAVIYDIKQNHSCCGHYYYNTSLWSCCAEHLKPTPKPDSPLALKPLMDLIPEMCNKTVFFGKVESVALLNDQRLVMLKVVWQVNVNSGNFTLDPWLLVSLDHCSSPATDNGMTYLWEKEHSGELTSLHTYKLLSHPVDLISDIHMFYSVCYQKKG
ncbi:galaxin-like isoform X4 [Labeo rohita]|uniref:Galaxin-like isoform X4 n=1 Tax=Labeo rohita TaxID=84645 RepID=A0A498LAH6_LABRO|nr:galaxin-like isoform X4 [Labeo rohita]